MRVSGKNKPRKHPSRTKSSKEKKRHLLLLSPSQRKWQSLHPRSRPPELPPGPPHKKKKMRLPRRRNPLKGLKKSQEREENMWLNLILMKRRLNQMITISLKW